MTDNKRRDEMAWSFAMDECKRYGLSPASEYFKHFLEGFKKGYDSQGREDASQWKCCGEKSDCYQCDKGPPANYKDPQPTQLKFEPSEKQPTERREFFAYPPDAPVSEAMWSTFEKEDSRQILVRDVGAGLVPIEDVKPLLEILSNLNEALVDVDDITHPVHKVLTTFYAKHPGVGK